MCLTPSPSNVALRRREFATLKSVGMTRKGFNRMMNYECLLYGLRALLVGGHFGAVHGGDLPQTSSIVVGSPMIPWKQAGIAGGQRVPGDLCHHALCDAEDQKGKSHGRVEK